ncbi:unnamed protein product, partial [Cladocopium goreaui]
MSEQPPKRERGRRGGDPFRRSQVARKAAGLVSHLDYFDPEQYEIDREGQRRREERSRSAAEAGAVAKEVSAAAVPVPVPPPPARTVHHTESVRSLSSRRVITSSSSVSVPARPIAPPPTPTGGASGEWQLSWVWVEHTEAGSRTPETPPKAAPPAKRRSRSPLPRRSKPFSAAASKVPAPTVAPVEAEPKVPKKPRSPKQRKAETRKVASRPSSVDTAKPSSSTKLVGSAPSTASSSAPSSCATTTPAAPERTVKITPVRKAKELAKGAESEVAKPKSLQERTVQLKPAKAAARSSEVVADIAPSSTASGARSTERPLIGLDWHKTLSHERETDGGALEGFVPASSIAILRDLLNKGWDLCVVSFGSALATQNTTLTAARALEQRLQRPFKDICIVPRKRTSDWTKGPSVTGHTQSKAELVVAITTDSRSPSDSLRPLERLIRRTDIDSVPLPSYLKKCKCLQLRTRGLVGGHLRILLLGEMQLEHLVESTVQYRVEATVSQMREKMNMHLARIELEHQARLNQAEQASRLAMQRIHAEGSQQISQVQHERDLAVQQLSKDAHQLQQVQQEKAILARQAEGEIMTATQRAEAQISILAADNQKLVGDRQQLHDQMQMLRQELAAAKQQLMNKDLLSSASSVVGFPPMMNPFDIPAVQGSPASEHLSGPQMALGLTKVMLEMAVEQMVEIHHQGGGVPQQGATSTAEAAPAEAVKPVAEEHDKPEYQDPPQVEPVQEHSKKAKRKAQRRRKWESATTTGQGGSSERKIHGISINEMVLDMSQFYEQMAQTKDASEAAVYRQIAKDISEEHATFDNSDPPGEAEYNIIKTSQAGLKISQDMTLAPPQTGAGPAEHKIGYKKKQRRKPLRQ